MNKIHLIVFLLTGMLFSSNSTAHALLTYLDSYEVSYIYNTLSSDSNYSPIGPVEYTTGLLSNPVEVNLSSGAYQLKLASGRQTGNTVDKTTFDAAVSGDLDNYWTDLVNVNNPGAVTYQSGYDGGNTNPSNFPTDWFYGTAFWVGTSENSGSGDRFFGLGSTSDIVVNSGENLWLFWNDNYSKDNLGGVTVELWKNVEETSPVVPEPSSLFLLGSGIVGAFARKMKLA